MYRDTANLLHPEGCKCSETNGGGDCDWCRVYYATPEEHKEWRELVDYPELPRLTIADLEAAAESYTEDRITALLPKIKGCATARLEFVGGGKVRAITAWDLPKLRQVLKEGMR